MKPVAPVTKYCMEFLLSAFDVQARILDQSAVRAPLRAYPERACAS